MRRIVVTNSLTLGGVMQAPGRADEDTRGGFLHGGWAQPYFDHILMEEMGAGMAEAGPMLFGRRTFEDFASVWPRQPADNPFAAFLNSAEKYVVSNTMTGTPTWSNTTLLNGDVIAAVTALKEQSGPDISILGSGNLVRSLMRHDLIDEFTLLIHPLLLGAGQRMFTEAGSLTPMTLIKSVPTTTGVIIATYRPAAPPSV